MVYRIVSTEEKYGVWTPQGKIKFRGTYTQCLIYIGAITLGHNEEAAKLEANKMVRE